VGGTVFQLLGYPGTGKYTVAREMTRLLREDGHGVSLMDNHSTANLVWDLVPGERRFDADVLEHVIAFRLHLLDIAVELSPPDWSFIATNFVGPRAPENVFDIPRRLAERRDARLVGVVLTCSTEERERRVVSPGRAERLKVADVELLRRIIDAGMRVPDWPDLVELGTTALTPTDAAAKILALATG